MLAILTSVLFHWFVKVVVYVVNVKEYLKMFTRITKYT